MRIRGYRYRGCLGLSHVCLLGRSCRDTEGDIGESRCQQLREKHLCDASYALEDCYYRELKASFIRKLTVTCLKSYTDSMTTNNSRLKIMRIETAPFSSL